MEPDAEIIAAMNAIDRVCCIYPTVGAAMYGEVRQRMAMAVLEAVKRAQRKEKRPEYQPHFDPQYQS